MRKFIVKMKAAWNSQFGKRMDFHPLMNPFSASLKMQKKALEMLLVSSKNPFILSLEQVCTLGVLLGSNMTHNFCPKCC